MQSNKLVGLIKFDISQYAGAYITEAFLRLFPVTLSDSHSVSIYEAASNDWAEGSVTWNTAPSKASAKIADLTITSTGQYFEADISAYVLNAWTTSHTAVTFWLESGLPEQLKFESMRNDKHNPPQLRVTTGCDSSPPPPKPPRQPPGPPLPSPTPSLPPAPPAPSPLPFAPPLPPSPPLPPPLPSSPKRCPTSIPANTILGQYFDIAAGSVNGSWVSGRLNPKANRNWRTEPLASWSFTLIEDANGLIEVINERDTEGRLFGGLRVSDGRTLGGAGDDVELVAELYRSNELVGCHAFRVHVLEQTVMSVMRQRVLDYALTENHMWGRNQPSESSISSMASSVVSSSGRLPGAPSMHLKVLYRPPRRPKASST